MVVAQEEELGGVKNGASATAVFPLDAQRGHPSGILQARNLLGGNEGRREANLAKELSVWRMRTTNSSPS